MHIDKDDSLRLKLNEHAHLRPLKASDVTEQYVNGLNDREVNRFLIGPRARRQTMASVKEFVCLNRELADSILFGLYIADKLRGTIRLHEATSDSVFLGLALFDKNVWGQGWGKAMIKAVTLYALQDLGIKQVVAGIEFDNIASQKAFSDSGFVHDASKDRQTEHGYVQLWVSAA